MGIGGRYKVTKKVSVNSEYFYALSTMTESHQNMLSVGVDIETGGHVFSLHLSNSRGMNEQAFLTQTTGQWLEGDIYFGLIFQECFHGKTSNSFDFAIVGGGIVGLSCAYKLQVEYPQLNIVVFEKEQSLAAHQTGRNSGLFIQVIL